MMRKLHLLFAPIMVLMAFASQAVAAPLGYVVGSEAKQQVGKLTGGIQWYQDVSQARSAAHKEHKMVMWIHMLGKLEGAT